MLPFRSHAMISHPFLTHATSTTNLDYVLSYRWGQYALGRWFIEKCSVKTRKEISSVSYECEHYDLIFFRGSEHCWSLPVWVLLASYSLTLQPQDLPSSPVGGRKFQLNGQTLSSTKTICLACSLSLSSVTQRLKPRWGENSGPLKGFSFPPLNLGNAETGYLTQANLLSIARRVGADWQTIGLNLGLTYQQIERIEYNNR